MSDALESQGFKLEIETNSVGPVLTEVKEIVSFTGLDGQASEIDVTHMQSAAKEFRMGLQDFGTFQLETNYLPEDPGQVAMRAAKASRLLKNFTATLSDGSTIEFSGFVLAAPVSGGVDSKIDGSFTIRISGDVTFTDAP